MARLHRATYARDKRKGGYLIRVEGPNASRFAGRTIPVTRRDGTESDERLDAVVWSGMDEETGKPVTLYTFTAQERRPDEEIEF